ncbi:MAG: small multi-drug export protein [Candidatus Thermoplasmatota archaeon]|jgi:uncharacterized membrane protein|nr:small multi-drug export protein [Candidatus Thermoplasmatota archaeon]
MSSLAEVLMETLGSLPLWGKYLATMVIAMLPIIELRGALPAAINVFKLSYMESFLLSVIGNMVPIPFIMLFFSFVERFLRRFKQFNSFFDWLFERTRKKGEVKLQVWGMLGLMLFVAIPLPLTGAWTGTLVAYLLKLDKKRSFLFITAGVVIAGVIMVLLNFYSIWVGITIIAVLALLLYLMGRFEEKMLKNSSGP